MRFGRLVKESTVVYASGSPETTTLAADVLLYPVNLQSVTGASEVAHNVLCLYIEVTRQITCGIKNNKSTCTPSLVQCVSFADYVFGEWSFPQNHIPNFIKTPLKVCRLQQISSKYNPSSLPLLRTVFLQPKICIEYKVSFYLICNRYILESKKSCHP